MKTFALLMAMAACAGTVFAQPKPPTIAPLPPGYPKLAAANFPGGAPGKSVEVVLTGDNLIGATAVVGTFPGTATIVEPPKEANKLKVKFDLRPDAQIGLYSVRVATEAGISNLRPFIVDPLPLVQEAEGNANAKKETAQVVPVPCVIAGTANVEANDFYRFKAAAGQALLIEAVGRRIGSPIDPVVILYDAKGNDVPGLWADDSPGLQTDARFAHTFKEAGEYIVEVRDTTYRGGPEFAYRLRIAEAAAATCAYPLAVERKKPAEIGFAGLRADQLPKVAWKPNANRLEFAAIPQRSGSAAPGWPVAVQLSDHPELVEQEPNNSAEKANAIPLPGGITARFAEKNDVDWFKFPGKKGQKVVVQALSHEMNLSTEVFLRLLDGAGKELMKSDPQKPGVKLEYTPTADGDVFVACEQNNYAFGPNEVYRVVVRPASPDFAVTFGRDVAHGPVEGFALVPISGVTRSNGFDSPIELEYAGSKFTIPPGANPTAAAPLYFPVDAPKGTKVGGTLGPIRATAKDIVRFAINLDATRANLGAWPNPPLDFQAEVAVAWTPAAPFALELKLDKTEIAKGSPLKGTVTVKRANGFEDEIALAAAGFTLKPTTIPKGKSEVAMEITAATVGPGTILLTGKVKETIVNARPVAITVTEPPKK